MTINTLLIPCNNLKNVRIEFFFEFFYDRLCIHLSDFNAFIYLSSHPLCCNPFDPLAPPGRGTLMSFFQSAFTPLCLMPHSLSQLHNSGNNRFRFWRTSRDICIYRNYLINRTGKSISLCKYSSRTTACTYGNHQDRFWSLIINFKKSFLITGIYGSVNQKNISMSDTAHKQNTEPFQIMSWCQTIKYFNITIIA